MLWLCSLAVSSVGRGAVIDHLYWGEIAQNRVYTEPADINPVYIFLIELETDEYVDHVEFLTPGGRAYIIPGDSSVVNGNIETYHELWEGFDVWGYWAYLTDRRDLYAYGDGWYTITLHYANGSVVQTDVWYGEPDTAYAMVEPVQKPHMISPAFNDAVPSPVAFTWEECVDPNVYDVYLSVSDPGGQTVVSEIFDFDVTASDAYTLDEGWHDVELAFENYWPIYNDDAVPFDLIKSSILMHQFEVLYNSVYRFWSPITSRHFYTADADERDKLIDNYSYAWTYEGTAFHACATDYYAGLAPVHRFWSSATSSHFYTIDEAEKTKLITMYPYFWTYEGTAFYAYPQGLQPPEARPVHRFWKPSDGTHFYTMSDSEVDMLLRDYPHVYLYEGVAYYAYE